MMGWSLASTAGRWLRTGFVLALLALTAACSTTPTQPSSRSAPEGHPDLPWSGGRYYQDDGPGAQVPHDIDQIADAQPRDEPIHRGTSRPYSVFGVSYTPMQSRERFVQEGRASWYGRKFHGKRTATGEPYDMYAMTGAHKTLPLPSYVRVTNLENGRSVVVRVNDRGPFHSSRIIDLSYAAAYKLGYLQKGSTRVRIETVFADDPPLATPAPMMAESTPEPAVVSAPAGAGTLAQAPDVTEAVDPAAILAGAEVPELMPAAEPTASGGVYVQLGAFRSREKAESLLDQVGRELGWIKAQLSVLSASDAYRLHAGPYPSTDAARDVARRIANALDLTPFVVTR
jgi:rare lipoprotein A